MLLYWAERVDPCRKTMKDKLLKGMKHCAR